MSRQIHSFDYVNHAYAAVAEVLRRDALSTFRSATQSASSRAHDVAAALKVELGGMQIAKDISIKVNHVEEKMDGALGTMVTQIDLEWEAARQAAIFPLMHGQLKAYALTKTETQLEFTGQYDPPLGALGKAINAIVGHRIAEASVHRFLGEVAEYLRKSIK